MTTAGESRPTQVGIFEPGKKPVLIDLNTEQKELWFISCQLPEKYKLAQSEADVKPWCRDQMKYRSIADHEDISQFPEYLVKVYEGKKCLVTHVPSTLIGIEHGDTVLMLMGGCGDDMAYAITQRSDGENMNVRVRRAAPHALKSMRNDDKDNDTTHLKTLFETRPDLFYQARSQDRNVIELRSVYKLFEEAMKARIACGQRIAKAEQRRHYCSGMISSKTEIELAIKNAQANSTVLQDLIAEELGYEKQLISLLKQIPVFTQVMKRHKGVGPRIAARIITAVVDIRRFRVMPDPDEMTKLHKRSKEIEDYFFEPIKRELAITPGMKLFERLDLAICHYRAEGQDAACNNLRQAKEYHEQRSKLRKKAMTDTQSKFKAFVGAHLVKDDEGNFVFPRRRRGVTCNWSTDTRLALYLLGDQFVKQPDSFWGKKLIANKAALRTRHPDVITENGKKRYTNGHIHKMAIWRTISQFVSQLCEEWVELEEGTAA